MPTSPDTPAPAPASAPASTASAATTTTVGVLCAPTVTAVGSFYAPSQHSPSIPFFPASSPSLSFSALTFASHPLPAPAATSAQAPGALVTSGPDSSASGATPLTNAFLPPFFA